MSGVVGSHTRADLTAAFVTRAFDRVPAFPVDRRRELGREVRVADARTDPWRGALPSDARLGEESADCRDEYRGRVTAGVG